MKTIIGIVTFGGLDFTKLCIRGIRETATRPYELCVIVGNPDDRETHAWLAGQQIDLMLHERNHGFPASVNDLYDRAFVRDDAESLILVGNDVVPYPGAIDAMIDLAGEGEWEWICASQFDSKSLVARYPEAARHFTGPTMTFTDFEARPWMLHEPARLAELAAGGGGIEAGSIKDVRNLCLFRRSTFLKLGYADANFWPGGYFEDNDYCRRAGLAGIKACGLPRAAYFHFWSRTIHQGEATTTGRRFEANRQHYIAKWGGDVGRETRDAPIRIPERGYERDAIETWRRRNP